MVSSQTTSYDKNAFLGEIEGKTGSGRKCDWWIVYFDPLLFESREGPRPAGLKRKAPLPAVVLHTMKVQVRRRKGEQGAAHKDEGDVKEGKSLS